MTDLEAPWTVGYSALAEHDPVPLHKVYVHSLGADVDVAAGAAYILEHPPQPRWQELSKKAGMLILSGVVAGVSAYGLYGMIYSIPPLMN